MKRLAVVPSDPIADYLKGGYSESWLRDYYNPGKFFDEVYLFSPEENDSADCLGMRVVRTPTRDFKKNIRRFQIDVVRAYGGNWACRLACENKVAGVPVVVSVHDTRPELLYNSVAKADVVFCVAKAVEKLVHSKYARTERIWSLPNRVDFDIMKPSGADELHEFKFQCPFKYKILHVGRLVEQKNLDTLLKALAVLGKDYGVIVVGMGDKIHYQNIALQAGVVDRTVFIESVNHHDLAKYYSLCDCMCTPSRWEGFGMVFIEALACESVVVTSDIAPMNEFIKDTENGLLVKSYQDPMALAKTIREACQNESLRRQLKMNARSSVERFERRHIDQLEADYYKKILLMKDHKEFEGSFWQKIFQRA
ncbi:MAG: glycosyltransferase family 4 protein [Candidatus Omnitrophica bacterium]|nr:glycosyltransferase family 4 protein [Candidatus Omnitrophota bacterium]